MAANLLQILNQDQVDMIVNSWRTTVNTNNQQNNIEINNNRKTFTLMDLISIFTDESYKICEDNSIASLIALESLRDYIKKHVDNVNVTY